MAHARERDQLNKQADAIGVLACNWVAVEVYQRCQLTFVATGGKPLCLGLSSTEIHAALSLHQVPIEQWPDLTDRLLAMSRAATRATNKAINRTTSTPRQAA
ncbi:MAG: hypothetical protein AB1832_01215 [Pseudomonadota bacterium]